VKFSELKCTVKIVKPATCLIYCPEILFPLRSFIVFRH